MKRLVIGTILLAGVAALLTAQGFAVVISNAEHSSFYYVLDPPELTAFDASGSIFPNVLYDYFAEAPAAGEQFAGFTELKPGEDRRLDNLSEGKHLLVGFFTIPGQSSFPVRAITLQAGGGLNERNYRIYSEPSLIQARAGRGRIAAYPATPAPTSPAPAAPAAPPAEGRQATAATSAEGEAPRLRIDNNYEDWEEIPAFISFPADQSLSSFTREQYGADFEVLPITNAQHWRQGGTSLNQIKVVNEEAQIYLYVSTYSVISPNLSIYLYFHSEGDLSRLGAENRFTMELVPARAEEPGLVVLWEKERGPELAGELVSGNFFLEARIDKDKLKGMLRVQPRPDFFDLTTSFFDRQELAYEEFYLTSVPLNAIPAEQEPY
jgi:hypothetical protein